MIRKFGMIALGLALVATACGSDDAADTTTAATGDAVVLTSSSLGDILTDQAGNTLYLFVPDNQGPSVCNDQCAAVWPPLLAGPAAGDGVDSSLLSTAARDDGTVQVTYNGWPLYYFANDASPGDVNGQGVNEVWFVLDAAGNAVSG